MDWQAIWSNFLHGLADFAGNVVLAAVIFFGGWFLARLAARLTKKTISKGKVDALAASFFGSLVKAVVLVVAGVSAVAQLPGGGAGRCGPDRQLRPARELVQPGQRDSDHLHQALSYGGLSGLWHL